MPTRCCAVGSSCSQACPSTSSIGWASQTASAKSALNDSRPAGRGGSGRHRVPAYRGCGLRDHGRATCRRKCCYRFARQLDCHRRRAGGAHPDLRSGFRRAPQPCGFAGGRHSRRSRMEDVPAYVTAQVFGAFAGVAIAHLMFGEPVFTASSHARSGPAQVFAEFVATFGLLSVILGCSRSRSTTAAPFAVAAYITGAYWFTSSTSFANPAVTLARAATDTFSGIRPNDAPMFLLAQLAGAMAATTMSRWLWPALPAMAPNIVVPHRDADQS